MSIVNKATLNEMLFSYKNSENVVLGANQVIRLMKKGKLDKLILSKNCSDELLEAVNHYSKFGDVDVISTDLTNVELGTFFRKPFLVTIAGIMKN